jgi:hypothetical protein
MFLLTFEFPRSYLCLVLEIFLTNWFCSHCVWYGGNAIVKILINIINWKLCSNLICFHLLVWRSRLVTDFDRTQCKRHSSHRDHIELCACCCQYVIQAVTDSAKYHSSYIVCSYTDESCVHCCLYVIQAEQTAQSITPVRLFAIHLWLVENFIYDETL